MTTVDTSHLNPTGQRIYDAIDRALRAEIGRLLPSNLTADNAHTAALIATHVVNDELGDINTIRLTGPEATR